MNSVLSELMEDITPKFNATVLNGVATKDIKSAPEYIDNIIKSSMRSASHKLEYHGWRYLSPQEEYETLFTTGNNRINYDVARSDLYKIELLFSYNGVRLPKRYLYLPYLDDGGIMKISDTSYHIIPVLSDTVVSPSDKEVFVRLLRDKLIFKRKDLNVIVDGKKVSGDVIHSTIYRTNTRGMKDMMGSVFPPIALYLYAENCLKGTFLKYAGIEPIITYQKDVTEYKDTHVIYESTKMKPRTLKDNNYVGHNVKILIPKGSNTPLVKNLIYGLIYTLDIYPHNAEEMVDIINKGDLNDHGSRKRESTYWKQWLGTIIFKDSYSVDRITADMEDHFVSLRSYIDNLIKEKLAEININVNDFFDLLAVILGKYSDWLLNNKTYTNNIFNRYVDVLYYILYDIILGINKTIFEVTRKSSKKDLNDKEVARIFNSHLSSKKIYSIVKASSTNITLLLVDFSGDCKFHKMTSVLELQERGKNVTKNKSSVFPKGTRDITGPDLFQGNILYLTKKAPTPKIRINPFITIDESTGRPSPTPEIMEKIMLLDKMFKGKLDKKYNKKIAELAIEDDKEMESV